VKVGDLVRHTPSGELGLIIAHDDWATLVEWLDEIGEIEDASIYDGELEVASEA
jgi:hypothetical protein